MQTNKKKKNYADMVAIKTNIYLSIIIHRFDFAHKMVELLIQTNRTTVYADTGAIKKNQLF